MHNNDYDSGPIWGLTLRVVGSALLLILVFLVNMNTDNTQPPSQDKRACVRFVDGIFLPCSEVWNNPYYKALHKETVYV